MIYCKRLNPNTCISIHALREEGDVSVLNSITELDVFLSTPSARRATKSIWDVPQNRLNFYPRPPRGGRRPCRP